MILLDVPGADADDIAARLEQFHFAEDVRIESLAASLRAVWIHGPAAASILDKVATHQGPPYEEWGEYQNARADVDGSAVVVARIDQLGVPGYAIYADVQREAALTRSLSAAGAVLAAPSTLDVARIEAGYPIFGVDMTTDTIPLEAGIEDRAISLTKGCYVGQEVIIRVLHRGGGRVARKLARLRVEGAVPGRGAKIFTGDREIGFVTSAATSPRLGSIALGYLHRDFLEPGTEVAVDSGDGRSRAVVTSRRSSTS
jgi:folate-binding protein YgfZ